MIQRNTNRRKPRKKRRQNRRLEFERLEVRKMLAADGLPHSFHAELLAETSTQQILSQNLVAPGDTYLKIKRSGDARLRPQ